VALKREPAPPGAIADLFDRLHQLYLHAGEPGVRQIASGIGRGVISYTTIHNVFRGPRVPKWGYLELIVEQLDGDVEEIRQLWVSAREKSSRILKNPQPTSQQRFSRRTLNHGLWLGLHGQPHNTILSLFRTECRCR
jgi:hypothetical protein